MKVDHDLVRRDEARLGRRNTGGEKREGSYDDT